MSEGKTEYFELKNAIKYVDDIWCRVAVMDGTVIDFVDVKKDDDLASGRMPFFYKSDKEYIGVSLEDLEKDIKSVNDPTDNDEFFIKRKISEQEFIKSKNIRDMELKKADMDMSWEVSDAKDRVNRKILEKKAAEAGYEKPKISRTARKTRKEIVYD